MKNTAKLAFDMLEKEVEVISNEKALEILGGTGSTGIGGDWESAIAKLYKAQNGAFDLESIGLGGQGAKVKSIRRENGGVYVDFGWASELAGYSDGHIKITEQRSANGNITYRLQEEGKSLRNLGAKHDFDIVVDGNNIYFKDTGTYITVSPPSSSGSEGLAELDSQSYQNNDSQDPGYLIISTGIDDLGYFQVRQVIDSSGNSTTSLTHQYYGQPGQYGDPNAIENWNYMSGMLSSGTDDIGSYFNYSYLDEFGSISTGYYHPDYHMELTGNIESTGAN